MASVRMRIILSTLNSFFIKNKKVILCLSIVFILSIVIGVVSVVRAVENEFERIPRADMNFGGAKVFFISTLALMGGYLLILVSGYNNKTVFIAMIPFIVLGFMCGQYSCILIARYEGTGLINLLFAYMPFFMSSFICMIMSAVTVLSSGCSSCASNSTLKPSFINTLKIFAINVSISFVFILIFGSIYGVVIVELY